MIYILDGFAKHNNDSHQSLEILLEGNSIVLSDLCELDLEQDQEV